MSIRHSLWILVARLLGHDTWFPQEINRMDASATSKVDRYREFVSSSIVGVLSDG